MSNYQKKGNLGGYRPGSGRKPGQWSKKRILETEARNIAVQMILEDWQPMVDTLKTLALGNYYIDESPDGSPRTRIYKQSPDQRALSTLLEMVVGKPKQQLEHGGSINNPDAASAINTLAASIAGILKSKPVLKSNETATGK